MHAILQLNAPGENCSKRLRAFDTNVVILQIQVGQWGLEKPNAREDAGEATDALVLGFWASDGGADWTCSILPGGAQLR